MASLDMPHHLRQDEWCRWREGVVDESVKFGYGSDAKDPYQNGERQHRRKMASKGFNAELSHVDCGLQYPVTVGGRIPANTRVTLDFGDDVEGFDSDMRASAAHPAAPREEDGYYWGYSVRRASSLSAVLTECGFEGGYDFCVGTSERGESVQDFLDRRKQGKRDEWQHLLMVFGGVAGLEVALQNDSELSQTVDDPKELFDAYLNLVPNQGSRTIRTEEAVWLGCMGLRPFMTARDQG